jgi:hypothetical protein
LRYANCLLGNIDLNQRLRKYEKDMNFRLTGQSIAFEAARRRITLRAAIALLQRRFHEPVIDESAIVMYPGR